MLVRYTKGRTGTNMYGFEVAIDRNAIAVSDPIYGEGNMEVPGGGGYVLSGHGEAGKWLYGASKAGVPGRQCTDGDGEGTEGVLQDPGRDRHRERHRPADCLH